jgi:hypothetical protein
MLKFSIICVILTAVTIVLGCDTACIYSSDRSGCCYYSCSDNACHLSETRLRDQFLVGLRNKMFSCRVESSNSLSCAKTADLGTCTSHQFICGRDCEERYHGSISMYFSASLHLDLSMFINKNELMFKKTHTYVNCVYNFTDQRILKRKV